MSESLVVAFNVHDTVTKVFTQFVLDGLEPARISVKLL